MFVPKFLRSIFKKGRSHASMSAEVAGCIVCRRLHAKRTILEHSWYIPTVTFGVVHRGNVHVFARVHVICIFDFFFMLYVGISLSFRISAALGT